MLWSGHTYVAHRVSCCLCHVAGLWCWACVFDHVSRPFLSRALDTWLDVLRWWRHLFLRPSDNTYDTYDSFEAPTREVAKHAVQRNPPPAVLSASKMPSVPGAPSASSHGVICKCEFHTCRTCTIYTHPRPQPQPHSYPHTHASTPTSTPMSTSRPPLHAWWWVHGHPPTGQTAIHLSVLL